MSGKSPLGAVAVLFSGPDQTGDAVAIGSSAFGPRYDVWDQKRMLQVGAWFEGRSARVLASAVGAAALIVCEGRHQWGSDFHGEFIQLTNAHPEVEWNENMPEAFFVSTGTGGSKPKYGPMTGSMLVLQTQRRPEIRVSFRDTFLPVWNQFTTSQLPEQVVLKGDPLLTWMAFPRSIEFLNENSIYLFIEQEIEIDFTDFWPNYAATFAYWLHLHVNGGVVTGHVAKWRYWIESGAFASVMEAILRPNLELSVGKINNALNQALGALPPTVQGIYYLPGRQLTPVGPGFWNFHWQHTESDVTIVFET